MFLCRRRKINFVSSEHFYDPDEIALKYCVVPVLLDVLKATA